jgi:hypothetical protein
MFKKFIGNALAALGALCFIGSPLRSSAQTVHVVPVVTGLTQPIGLTTYLPTNQLLTSVHYETGGRPNNFELLSADGTHTPFGTKSQIDGEIKLVTVEQPCGGQPQGGFTAGDIFYGVQGSNKIYRIPVGSTVPLEFATLGSGGGDAISLAMDTSGAFGGDLIAVAGGGDVFRINSGGVVTKVASLAPGLDQDFEGVTTVPNNPAKYNLLAGTILVGGESDGKIYAVTAAGGVSKYDFGITTPENVAVIPANRNLFIANFGNGLISGVSAADLAPMAGDILISQEFGNGFYRVHWDGTQFVTTRIGSYDNQGEQMTFSTAGLGSIAPIPLSLTASVSTNVLWPPNHDLVDVGLVADVCAGFGVSYAVTVYSNEDDQDARGGDDRFSPDAKNSAGVLRLRSERTGYGDGRVYVVVVTSTNIAGQTTSQVLTVVVPHSQSAADIAAVQALAAQALTQQAAFVNAATASGAIPSGYFLVGDGPVVGPKQ